jgi:hypothetical protein
VSVVFREIPGLSIHSKTASQSHQFESTIFMLEVHLGGPVDGLILTDAA